MAGRKKPPRCTGIVGHCADAEKRAKGMEDEVTRINRKLARVVLEKGPRCQHTPGPATDEWRATNHRLISDLGRTNRALQEALSENDALRVLLTPKQYDAAVKKGILSDATRNRW